MAINGINNSYSFNSTLSLTNVSKRDSVNLMPTTSAALESFSDGLSFTPNSLPDHGNASEPLALNFASDSTSLLESTVVPAVNDWNSSPSPSLLVDNTGANALLPETDVSSSWDVSSMVDPLKDNGLAFFGSAAGVAAPAANAVINIGSKALPIVTGIGAGFLAAPAAAAAAFAGVVATAISPTAGNGSTLFAPGENISNWNDGTGDNPVSNALHPEIAMSPNTYSGLPDDDRTAVSTIPGRSVPPESDINPSTVHS